MSDRADIEFDSAGERCRAWFYEPQGAGQAPWPCVVMGHGLGATKEAKLDSFAERFAAAGMAVLAFDYRHFGESEGEPRQLVDVRRQHRDWESAIAYARAREDLDPDRIGLWGSSFGGGHVVHTAAHDHRVAAVVAQIPHASGPAGVAANSPRKAAFLMARGIADAARGLTGKEPVYVDVVGPEGSMAVLTTDEADGRYREMYPEGWEIDDRVAARFTLTVGAYSPGRQAAKIECPILVVVAEQDTITPPGPARKIAERAPRGELLTFPGGHFEAYHGETMNRIAGAEADFLARHLT